MALEMINNIKYDVLKLEDFGVPDYCVIAELATKELVKNGVRLAPVHNILKVIQAANEDIIGKYIVSLSGGIPLEVKIQGQSYRPITFAVKGNDLIFVDVERYFAKNKNSSSKQISDTEEKTIDTTTENNPNIT